ncbi:MAG: DUF1598 domain-containing protein [Planctomycetaceae bacterium]|nr:DUF1598 domain-containing protein [Planctomycetaceae bacterium]
MRTCSHRLKLCWAALRSAVALGVLSLLCLPVAAQNQGGGLGGGAGGGLGGGGLGGGGLGGGGQGGFPGGIIIDADGLVNAPKAQRINLRLEQQRLKSIAAARLPADMTKASPLRMVSLTKLEERLQKYVDQGAEIPDDALYLAGITKIEYLFADEQSGDVIIAGPAEGFAAMTDGRVVGTETGRPVLVLDDLLSLIRLDSMNNTLGCSFDPEPSRLAAANEWNKANSSPTSRAVANRRFHQMADVLGNWNVTVFGLPENSHAALTTVEADFQLKLLALGLKKPAIRGFKSHLAMARPAENMMRRWWFAPRYEAIERTETADAFRLSGPRLQLMSQEELVDAQGNRTSAAFEEVSAEKYTQQFNRHLEKLCQQVPSFAATQNLFDLAVVTALIRQHDLATRVGWKPSLLLDERQLPLRRYTVPTEVPSMANTRSAGRSLIMGLIGGGVTVVPAQVASQATPLADAAVLPRLDAGDSGLWWWDAAIAEQ